MRVQLGQSSAFAPIKDSKAGNIVSATITLTITAANPPNPIERISIIGVITSDAIPIATATPL